MRYVNKSFTRFIKGKVIISFIIACSALFMAWSISKIAFTEMLSTVEKISEPNDKLKRVNQLYRGIMSLEQVHREMSVKKTSNYQDILMVKLKSLNNSIDTLTGLYKEDPNQIARIQSLRKLLKQREDLFLDYLRVRDGIINNTEVSGRVKSISGLISNSSKNPDTTTMMVTEKKTYTTVYPQEAKAEERGLLSKIFGKKKKTVETQPNEVTSEELKISVDTIAYAREDSIITKVQNEVRFIEEQQRKKSADFIHNQTELANAGNILTGKMLEILDQVERELVRQTALGNNQAKSVVNKSVSRMNAILIVCFLITAVLLGFILADISKSNKYRKELELAKDEAEYHSIAKQRFLSNMSHEIRTPLQAIIGFSDLILKQDIPKRQDIVAINQSSGHLLQIVNEVLDYSRIISGKFTFSQSTFNLPGLLDEVVSVMKLQATNKSLELNTDFESSLPEYIVGDAFRLRQILYNLINNAIKFTDKGSVKLGVSHKRNEDDVHLTFRVEDTGRGITEKNLKHIFNEFEQDGQSEVESLGTGLGLSIVKSLTEAQGGRIYVTSKLGEGACFTVYLKFKYAEKPCDETNESSMPALRSNTGKVWVVDDDKFILQLCSSVFFKNSIVHTCFNSPEEVLNTTWDPEVTCILLDMRMPGMNGQELRLLLKERIPATVKIFALTAQALPHERTMIMGYGFDGLLMKPFRENELIELVTNYTANNYEKSADNSLNLDVLREMTLHDEDLVFKILERFIEDSENDMGGLIVSLDEKNIENCILLLHRIAGRTAQLGESKLSNAFRELELTLCEKEVMDDELEKQVRNLLPGLSRVNNLVKNELANGVVSG